MIGVGRQVALHGRAYALVAPLIDGRTGDEQIVAGLAAELPAAVVQLALMRLDAQGLIAYVEPGTVPGPRSTRDPRGDPVASVELPPPGELRWVGIGVDEAVVSALRGAVAADERGCGRGVTVALVDDYLRPELDRLAARCREHDSALLPIGIGETECWIGPYCDGGAAERTWRLFDRRLRENRSADVRALDRGATFPLRGAPVFDAAADDRWLAYAAAAIERGLRGDPTPSLLGGLVVLDARDPDPIVHPIGVAAPAGPMLDRVAPLISPITGVIAGLERVTALAGTYVYASAGTLEWPDGADGEARPVFRHGALGKGLTDAQARASCVGEALELASTRFTGEEPRRRARWEELSGCAIHPRELLLVSDEQYGEAEARPPAPSWDGVPARLDDRHAIEWVASLSLSTGETRWLPAAYCYFGYDDPEYPAPMFAIANANGCAVGGTRQEAILRGLLELIERDACALWWYNRAARPAIELDGIGDPRIAAIREAHAALGRELALVDLRADTEVTVVAAVAWERDGTLLPIGRGCDLDPARAVQHALAELSQVTAVASPTEEPPAKLSDRCSARPADCAPTPAEALPDLRTADADEGIRWCVRMLARLGHDVLVLDTTRPEIGLPAVRVVVPGLRPLLRRLAPGRLYDVPVELGWIPRPLRQRQLNPDPFPS